MSTIVADLRPSAAAEPSIPEPNYINVSYGVKSWLLTVDHKRIGILYLLSITAMFFLGGLFAVMIRLELLTPKGDLFQADTYNKLFTMHGIIMLFFFLIPSIPSVLGNFLLPLMLGARDLAFPKLNLASWYIYLIGATFTLWAILQGGVDTGWTFYTPYSSTYSNSYVMLAAVGIMILGFSSILTGLNFVVTVHKMRAPGLTWFRLPLFVWSIYATSIIMLLGTPVITITLMLVGIERVLHVGIFDPRLGGDPILFQHLFWFYSHPAVYIMILPSMGVVSEVVSTFYAQRSVRLQSRCLCQHGHCDSRVSRLGPPYVCLGPVRLCRVDFLPAILSGCGSFRRQSVQLDCDALQGIDQLSNAHALCVRVHRSLYDRRPHGTFSGHAGNRRARDRYLFCRSPFPLHHGRRRYHGLHGRPSLLVAKNHRPSLSGILGPHRGRDYLHRFQSDVLSAVRAWLSWHAQALARVS